MNTPKIKSVTEAFSMQPITWEVTDKETDLPFMQDRNIAEIKLVTTLATNSPIGIADVLIGYDFHGNKLYEWQPGAVNISYFPIAIEISEKPKDGYTIDSTPLVIE